MATPLDAHLTPVEKAVSPALALTGLARKGPQHGRFTPKGGTTPFSKMADSKDC